jgi:transposase-like protein
VANRPITDMDWALSGEMSAIPASSHRGRRGLRGVKLVIFEVHQSSKALVSRAFSVTSQRCRVHFSDSALAPAGNSGRRVVSTFIATAFAFRYSFL